MYLTGGMGSIQKISPAGHFLAMWAVQTAHTFSGPGRLAVDGAGNVYVLLGNSRHGKVSTGGIAELSPQGRLLARWYSPTLLNAEFLAAGAAGTVFVIVPGQTKAGNPTGRVLKLSSTGAVLNSWHLSTAGHDFMTPVGIGLDVRGSVYVSGIAGRLQSGADARPQLCRRPVHLKHRSPGIHAVSRADHSGKGTGADGYAAAAGSVFSMYADRAFRPPGYSGLARLCVELRTLLAPE
ncbi:MAG: hypothetical protein NVS2B16_33580 [Chloroflexota bacterium]